MAFNGRRVWLFAVITLVVVIAVLLSGSFQECVAQIPDSAAYQQNPKGLPHFLFAFFSFLGCTGPFVHENSDPIIAIFTIVLAFSTIALWDETKRLRLGADQQADKMERSIAEAAKSAVAMQGVSEAMTINVRRVKESIEIQREIADRQKQVTELQSRAYLVVQFRGMVPQNVNTGIRFEPRMTLLNVGNTPAYNVKFCVQADVLPFPERADFTFPLPAPAGTSSMIGPRQEKIISAVVPKIYPEIEEKQLKGGGGQRINIWGMIKYDDAFGITRTLKFGQSFFWLEDLTTVMSHDTIRHNDAD